MTFLRKPDPSGVGRFRLKLVLAMMLLVSALTTVGLYVAQRSLVQRVEKDLQHEFESELVALHRIQDLRHTALSDVCRALIRKPRIHAALEDNALDLLYPAAQDELRDVMSPANQGSPKAALQALFYRFLDQKGTVIVPPNGAETGRLAMDEELRLSLQRLPTQQQLGYVVRKTETGDETCEVIAMTIVSSDTGDAIAALVLGFRPIELGAAHGGKGIHSGIWQNNQLNFPSLPESSRQELAKVIKSSLSAPEQADRSIRVDVQGVPHLLFYKLLNPDSVFPAAYEVSIFPLTDLQIQQQQLRWSIIGAGGVILLVGLLLSQALAKRLSVPVEKLFVVAEKNRAERERAEAELELSNEGLQRAVRFSADASHQLKTPVSVLRAGLEELLHGENLSTSAREEISNLIHQTYRLSSIVDDLLLLSRVDAGRLQLNLRPVNLTQLLEGALDDLGASPDPFDLTVETDFPPALFIAGEKRYTAIIVQNLLDNARKYNRRKGRIGVSARVKKDDVLLAVTNTGNPIPPEMQQCIFERFHRGSAAEDIPGHGLGLNLARELARLHGGDLQLVRSDKICTHFEVRFRLAEQEASSTNVKL